MQENKSTLEFKFSLKYMWPVLILGIFCSDGPFQRTLFASPIGTLLVLKEPVPWLWYIQLDTFLAS